jgi:hypothetical protein
VVAGSTVFHSDSPAETIREMRQVAMGATAIRV